jgi:hypothetical protein
MDGGNEWRPKAWDTPREPEHAGVMSQGFERFITAPQMRYAYQLVYSIQMLSDVSSGYDDAVDRSDFVLARCMLDAFYVNVRLLADFLVRPTSPKDFGPDTFGIQWSIPSGDAAARLNSHWKMASEYVVHFGHARVPGSLDDLKPFSIGGGYFKAMATDVLTVYGSFLSKVVAATPEWTQGALIPDAAAEPEAFNTRVLYERTAQLRGSFIDACSKLKLDAARLLEG